MYFLPELLHIDTATPQPPEARILILYTGGTVGMVYDSGNHLVPFDFSQILSRVPEMMHFNYHLDIAQFATPIDSSNISPAYWLSMAALIKEHYHHYDGFVVLHGTDTMAYSASALSFLLEGLSKPVVFTGAQVPIGRFRTDARYNLITALEVAGAKQNQQPLLPEVCICFGNVVLRGNRSKKVETSNFDAFKSDNYPALAIAGVELDYQKRYILPYKSAPLHVFSQMEENVMILKLFPGLTEKLVRSILFQSELKGVVLETYGSGNAPTEKWFLNCIEEAVNKGMYLLNVSQCDEGRVDQGKYETSKFFKEIGVIGGGDITAEAAITKLMTVLGKGLPDLEIKHQLSTALCGEMS